PAQYEPLEKLRRVNDADLLIYLTPINTYRDLLTFLPANNSLYQLSLVFEKIIQLAKAKNAEVIFLYIDLKLNNAVIYLTQSESNKRNKEWSL
ncbi:26770_t:CDS:2, partial [Gigaspora margarita]